jgi:hypothetical protein
LFACGAKIFFNKVVAPRFLGREGDLGAAEAAERDELPPLLDYLEGAVPDSGYLVGDRLTLADIAVAGPFANFSHCDVAIDSARYPKITAYVNAILSRPSFTQYVEREKPPISPGKRHKKRPRLHRETRPFSWGQKLFVFGRALAAFGEVFVIFVNQFAAAVLLAWEPTKPLSASPFSGGCDVPSMSVYLPGRCFALDRFVRLTWPILVELGRLALLAGFGPLALPIRRLLRGLRLADVRFLPGRGVFVLLVRHHRPFPKQTPRSWAKTAKGPRSFRPRTSGCDEW